MTRKPYPDWLIRLWLLPWVPNFFVARLSRRWFRRWSQ
jgi:hypothetical protein